MATRRPRFAPAILMLASLATVPVWLHGLRPAQADEETVTGLPLPSFMGARPGEAVAGLIYRGGIEMRSEADTFGGLSGLGFAGPDNHLVMVSDRGNFISGQLLYDEKAEPIGLIGVTVTPVLNTKGNDIPRASARDAEALAIIERDGQPAAVRVAFENVTRVADFDLINLVPEGKAREVTIPGWLSRLRNNRSLEAACIAPSASPIAGSTLLITEGMKDNDGLHSAVLLGRNDKGPLSYRAAEGMSPTDCAFLPDGDLLVLERGIGLLSFTMRLVRISASAVKPEADLSGTELLSASGADIDNMEALAVHTGPDGTTRITLVSDNNFNEWERSLLLEFSLPR
jgi:hypothetical protein